MLIKLLLAYDKSEKARTWCFTKTSGETFFAQAGVLTDANAVIFTGRITTDCKKSE